MKKITSSVGGIALAVCLLGAASAPALAEQVISVGRLDVTLPGDKWQFLSPKDEGVKIEGEGVTIHQKADTKVLVHLGADNVLDAIMIIRANASGIGRASGLVFSNVRCPADQGLFAEGDEAHAGARSFRCLRVSAPFSPATVPVISEAARKDLEKAGWKLPPAMVYVSSVQYATTGAYADVVSFIQPDAVMKAFPVGTKAAEGDDTEKHLTALPDGVMPVSVRWGRELQKAVTDSVYSFGGDLNVPPLVFEPETAKGGSDQNAPAAQPADASPATASETGKG